MVLRDKGGGQEGGGGWGEEDGGGAADRQTKDGTSVTQKQHKTYKHYPLLPCTKQLKKIDKNTSSKHQQVKYVCVSLTWLM